MRTIFLNCQLYAVEAGHISIEFSQFLFCVLLLFRNCTANIRYECLFLLFAAFIGQCSILSGSISSSLSQVFISLVPSVVVLTVMVALVSHWHAPIALMSVTIICLFFNTLIRRPSRCLFPSILFR